MLRPALIVLLTAMSPASAFAFDCKLAKTPSEKAICSDPSAVAADAKMNEAYQRLRATLPAEQQQYLRLSQGAWVQERDALCSPRQKIAECLGKQTSERATYLSGLPSFGPGTPNPFAPYIVYWKQSKSAARLSIEAIRFTDPTTASEKRINQFVDEATKEALDAANVSDKTAGDQYSVELSVRTIYSSPVFASVVASYESYFGQAHPFRWTRNLNINIASGRELTFSDLLTKSDSEKVFALCEKQVSAELRKRSGDAKSAVSMSEIETKTSELSAWSFESSRAVVSYDDDAFGGYGQCMCQCEIPYSVLRPLAKKEFPLPPE